MQIRLTTPLPAIHTISIGVVSLDRRWLVEMAAPFWRIYHNHNRGGRMVLQRPGLELTIPEATVAILPPGCRVVGHCTGAVDHAYLELARTPLPDVWVRRHWTDPVLVAPVADWSAVFDDLRSAPLGNPSIALQLRIQALIPACLAAAIESLPAVPRQALETSLAGIDPLAPALARMEADPAAPLDLAALGRACGMAKHHFAHAFRDRLGTTPGRWLRDHRLTTAAEHLVTTDRSIADIAQTVGFANRFHFSRLFTQVIGTPPATYRSQRQHARIHLMPGNVPNLP